MCDPTTEIHSATHILNQTLPKNCSAADYITIQSSSFD